MIFSERLYNFLINNAEISGAVGGRIAQFVAAAGTAMPYITYRIVSDVTEYTLDGDTGQGPKRVQISVFSDDSIEAATIAGTIDAELQKWPATDGTIQTVSRISKVELYEETTKTIHIPTDFEVFAEN